MNTDISQSSVATRFGCGGIFIYDFVTNFLLSLTVKEVWKSVIIWWSHGQELGVLFFDSQCRNSNQRRTAAKPAAYLWKGRASKRRKKGGDIKKEAKEGGLKGKWGKCKVR